MSNDPAVSWEEHWLVRDGVRLHYIRAGTGSPLLLLHGVTDNAAYWGWTGREFAKRFDVIALDQRGHGLSDAPAEGYAQRDYVADAAAVLRSAFDAPAVVMGHSFGGWVSTRLAAAHPDLVRALVLEDPPFRNPHPISLNKSEADAQRFAWFADLRADQALSHEERLAKCAAEHPTWSAEDCAHWAVSKAQVRPNVWEPDGIEFDLNWQEAASRVVCPTLLIHADAERGSIVDDAAAARVTAMMPNCRAVHIAGAGHAIHREQPKAMLAAVLEFLRAELRG